MTLKEALMQKQKEKDKERMEAFKKKLEQLNSPKQQRLFEQMGIRFKVPFKDLDELIS